MRPLRSRRLAAPLGLALALLAACEALPPAPPPAETPPATSSAAAASPSPVVSAAFASPAPASASAAEPLPPPPPPPDPPIALASGGKRAVRGDAGLVTSVEATATHVGVEVLRKGGNAVDAAVAVAFALAVTHPSAGNIGGGGFMIVRRASGETQALDFREAAPATATTASILSTIGRGAYGYGAAAVPGTVAGMALAHERFGSKPWAELVAPAIALARKGHRLGPRQAQVLGWAWPKLKADAGARAIWSRGGKPLTQGAAVRQLDLARTLEAIAAEGPRGFYEGAVAGKIAAAMRANGGHITEADLESYQAKVRQPLRFSYRGFTVDTMPPPSMGGVAFAQIMLTLERARAHEAPRDSALALHLFIEAARRAYADRRRASADPDFTVPEAASLLSTLLDEGYLARRKPAIDPARATPSAEIAAAPEVLPVESPQTTHFSVVDAQGNAVACTVTLSAGFGAKVVIPGTGVLLGNSLAAFSEAGPNTVAAGKRMQSSMTPAIASQNGRLALVLGSPGGDTIPNTVAQVFRNLVDHGMTIDEAVERGRLHHQWLPDRVRVEQHNAPPRAVLEELRRWGHVVELDATPIGDANDILVDAAGVAWGHADSREGGKAEGILREQASASASASAPTP